jgi:CheY-like chemotaxis protein
LETDNFIHVVGAMQGGSIWIPNTPFTWINSAYVFAVNRSTGGSVSAIVIIDDQSISRQILTAVIGSIKSQHEIVGFTGAKEAYDWAIRNPVALAVTDFKMPEMSGIEFIHQFRQHPAGTHVPVIMISGDLNVRAAALGAGANHFMLKPVDHLNRPGFCGGSNL